MREIATGASLLLALLQPLPCLFDIAVKNEESIGIAVGIREVEELPLPKLHPEVLLEIVDVERFKLHQRSREGIVLVARLVAHPLWRRDQAALARADPVLVDDVELRVQTHF